MPDRGAKYADKKIAYIDRKLRQTYRQAQLELTKKLNDFNRRFSAEDKAKRKQLADGEITEQEYKDWLARKVFQKGIWENKVRQVEQVMLHHNQYAMQIVNDSKFDVFAENYYSEAFKANWIIQGIGFEVYNTQAIQELLANDPQILPKWKIDEEKDYDWNGKKVNNIITQGIIQGESVEQITQRLCRDLSTQNENRMRLFARTAITEAQNAGRQVQMEQAAEMGVEVNKRWTAVHDSRTRDSHRAMDGEEVPFDKSFSNGLMHPGDPNGAPAEVYNCRCTMVSIYPKYEDRSKKYGEGVTIDGQSYEEWKDNKRNKKTADNKESQNNTERTKEKEPLAREFKGEDLDRAIVGEISTMSGMSEEDAKEVARVLVGVDGDSENCWCYGGDSAIRKGESEEEKKKAKILQQFIDRSPKYEGAVYRGMGLDAKVLDELQPGAKFDERRYSLSSWSSREDVGRRYASVSSRENGNERVVFIVNNPKHGVSIGHISPMSAEHEVIVNNEQASYVVVKREVVERKTGKFIFVTLEETR